MCTEVNNSQELELAVSTPPPGNGPLKGPRVDLSLGFSSADPEQPNRTILEWSTNINLDVPPASRGWYSVPWSNCIRTKTRSEGRRMKSDGGAVMMYLLLEVSVMLMLSLNLQFVAIVSGKYISKLAIIKKKLFFLVTINAKCLPI